MNEVNKQLLELLSVALFKADSSAPSSITSALKTEAINQAVYPLIHSVVSPAPDKKAYTYIRENMRNKYEHTEVGKMLGDIPYVILKGYASASYYSDPTLRTMGDVDFLIHSSDFATVTAILNSHGFKPEPDHGGIHVAFHRPPKSTWELHRSINGGNKKVGKYLETIIEDAREYEGMKIPSDFHHCLILLCHTASHLTSEGIGLRHLCDWAVFANKVDVSQWQDVLVDCGLWRFAQVLANVSVRYLHLPYQSWFGESDEELEERMIEDILLSGNFGHKDADRTRQIKYISNRGEHTVDKKNAVMQVWDTIKVKAESENKSGGRVVLDYIAMVARGERKLDTTKTVKQANARKKLYSELGLFESE